MNPPSQDTQNMLETLQEAVTEALEKKKRLGQYAVVWQDNKPIAIGEDAPELESTAFSENTLKVR